MSYHQLLNVFAPRQTRMEDVARVQFNICEPHTQLAETTAARLVRARKIAPVLLGPREIPVPPLPNPITGISHHRILLHNPLDRSRVVELFFRDTDLYFLGFCRGDVTFLDDNTPQYHWGICFVFDDLHSETPAFFQATKMGIDSAHTTKGDVPGPEAMLDVFYTLYNFQRQVNVDVDGDGISVAHGVVGQVKHNLEIAVGRVIIVFSEALRLNSLYTEVIAGLQVDRFSKPLPSNLWDLVHRWGTFSERVLIMRKRRMLNMNTPLPEEDDDYQQQGFIFLGDLIGPEGELVLCKMEVNQVISEKHKLKLGKEARRTHFADPGLMVEEAEGEEDED